jgi:hypothetical protein
VSKKELTVWFDQNGDLLMQGYSYSTAVAASYGYKSEVAKDFHDTMKVLRIQEYRRKNARVHLQSITSNRKYYMFVDEFNEVIQKSLLRNLHIEGTWRFIKKGTGQALELLEAKP